SGIVPDRMDSFGAPLAQRFDQQEVVLLDPGDFRTRGNGNRSRWWDGQALAHQPGSFSIPVCCRPFTSVSRTVVLNSCIVFGLYRKRSRNTWTNGRPAACLNSASLSPGRLLFRLPPLQGPFVILAPHLGNA